MPATSKAGTDSGVQSDSPSTVAVMERSNPSRAGSAVIELPDKPFELDMRSLGEALRPVTEEVSGEQEQDEELPTEDDDAEEGDEEITPSDPVASVPKTQHSTQEWAGILRTAHQRINEIPGKQRAEVIQMMLNAERDAVVYARQTGADEGRRTADQEAALREQLSEIDELKERDPAAFVEWGDQYPDRLNAYLAGKRRLAPRDPAVARQAEEEVNVASREVLADLDGHDQARARISALAAANPYPSTPAGLARLAKDVTREIAAEQSAKDAPVRQKAVERAASAQAHAARPKSLAPGGVGQTGELSMDAINAMNYRDLMAIPNWEEKAKAAMLRAR